MITDFFIMLFWPSRYTYKTLNRVRIYNDNNQVVGVIYIQERSDGKIIEDKHMWGKR